MTWAHCFYCGKETDCLTVIDEFTDQEEYICVECANEKSGW
ncbi:MAG: hypothetical protein ACFFCI_02330 [Promethearchaeota archaeon]